MKNNNTYKHEHVPQGPTHRKEKRQQNDFYLEQEVYVVMTSVFTLTNQKWK